MAASQQTSSTPTNPAFHVFHVLWVIFVCSVIVPALALCLVLPYVVGRGRGLVIACSALIVGAIYWMWAWASNDRSTLIPFWAFLVATFTHGLGRAIFPTKGRLVT